MVKKEIILVDKDDNEIGVGEKLEVHKKAQMHRAFSVFIFNSKGEMLIHKRAKSKYHSGGLWSNTCCSHPRPGKDITAEAARRLKEEMGIDCDNLKEVSTFSYQCAAENEIDHVFVGQYDRDPKPDPEEAEDWKWAKLQDIEKDIRNNPEKFTFWFKKIIKEYIDVLSAARNYEAS